MVDINKALHRTVHDPQTNKHVQAFFGTMQQASLDPHASTVAFLTAHQHIHDLLHEQLEKDIDVAHILHVYAKIAERSQLKLFEKNQPGGRNRWKQQAKLIGELLAAAEYFYALLYSINDGELDTNPFFSKISKANGLIHIDQACRKASDNSLNPQELEEIHRLIICQANDLDPKQHKRQALDACFYFSAMACGIHEHDIEDEKQRLIQLRFNQFIDSENSHDKYNHLLAVIEKFYPDQLLSMALRHCGHHDMNENIKGILQLCTARITKKNNPRTILKKDICIAWLKSRTSRIRTPSIKKINQQAQHACCLLDDKKYKISSLYSQLTKLHRLCEDHIKQHIPHQEHHKRPNVNIKHQAPHTTSTTPRESCWKQLFHYLLKPIKNRKKHRDDQDDKLHHALILSKQLAFLRPAILMDATPARLHRITRT